MLSDFYWRKRRRRIQVAIIYLKDLSYQRLLVKYFERKQFSSIRDKLNGLSVKAPSPRRRTIVSDNTSVHNSIDKPSAHSVWDRNITIADWIANIITSHKRHIDFQPEAICCLNNFLVNAHNTPVQTHTVHTVV